MYLFDDLLRAPDIARFIDSCHRVPVTRSPHRSKDNCPRYLLPISYSQITHHGKSLASSSIQIVENIQCGGNDLRLGFYAAERNGGSGDTMFLLCGERDHH